MNLFFLLVSKKAFSMQFSAISWSPSSHSHSEECFLVLKIKSKLEVFDRKPTPATSWSELLAKDATRKHHQRSGNGNPGLMFKAIMNAFEVNTNRT